jgi:hypothetical protein
VGKAMSGILLRYYSSVGWYPTQALSHKDASLVVENDLIFSAVRFNEVSLEDYFPEREWLKPEEIRLLSSVALSLPEDCGKVFFFPSSWSYALRDTGYDLRGKEVLQDLKKRILLEVANFEKERKYSSEEDMHYWLSSFVDVPPPPIFGGNRYYIKEVDTDVSRQKEIFEAIVIEDHLLIRGLGALLKGDILHAHSLFHTEACISLHIAMEATLLLILRRLRKDIANPSSKDASKFIGDIFGKYYPEHYFQDYYEDRIKAVHPANRFGVYPDAPLASDDFYDLYGPLRAVFDFLITGNVRKIE